MPGGNEKVTPFCYYQSLMGYYQKLTTTERVQTRMLLEDSTKSWTCAVKTHKMYS